MNDETRSLHGFAQPARPTLIVVAIVAAAFFASGFCSGMLLCRFRADMRSADRFREFVSAGIELGFIKVDEAKLNEAIITGTEGEWEDRDALDRAKGNEP